MTKGKGLWLLVTFSMNLTVEMTYVLILMSPLILLATLARMGGNFTPRVPPEIAAVSPLGYLNPVLDLLTKRPEEPKPAVVVDHQGEVFSPLAPENQPETKRPTDSVGIPPGPQKPKILTEEEKARQKRRNAYLKVRKLKANEHEPLYPKLDVERIPKDDEESIRWARDQNIDFREKELRKLPEFGKYYYMAHQIDGVTVPRLKLLRVAVSDMLEKAKEKGLAKEQWGNIEESIQDAFEIGENVPREEKEEATFALLKDLRDLEAFVIGAELYDPVTLSKAQADAEELLRKRGPKPTPLYAKWIKHRETSRDTDNDQRRLTTEVADVLDTAIGKGLPDDKRKEAQAAISRAKDVVTAAEVTNSLYELLDLLKKLEEFTPQ